MKKRFLKHISFLACLPLILPFMFLCSCHPDISPGSENSGERISTMPSEVESKDSSESQKEYTELKIQYTLLEDGNAEVAGYSGEGNCATISSEYEDHPVVRIAESAFAECESLESVVIWADIETIEASAFQNCTALTEISVPSSTTQIGAHAFEGCTALADLIIWGDPDIGDYAFAGCTEVEEVSISHDTKRVGEHAFDGCLELQTVIVWSDETVFGKDAFANCPKLENAPETETGSIESEATPSLPPEPTLAPTPIPTPSVEETSSVPSETDVGEEEHLTIENCDALNALTKITDPCDPTVEKFAKTYAGKIIEFDGCVTAMANYKDYDTRYSILINMGNFDPEKIYGPNFRLTNVSASDMGLDTLWVTDILHVGCNVHVIAEVEEYNADTTIFELDAIMVTVR